MANRMQFLFITYYAFFKFVLTAQKRQTQTERTHRIGARRQLAVVTGKNLGPSTCRNTK